MSVQRLQFACHSMEVFTVYSFIIVDDDYLVRKGILKKLEQLDGQIECIGEAENGNEAKELILKKKPDIVITDMYMPVVDGSELLKYISIIFPNIQIIVISGYRNFDYAQDTIRSKAVSYLVKPFSREEIQNSVLMAIKNIEDRDQKEQKMSSIAEECERISYQFDVQTLKSLIMGVNLREFEFNSLKLRAASKKEYYTLLTIVNIGKDIELLNLKCENILDSQKQIDYVICDHYFDSQSVFVILFFSSQAAATNLSKEYAENLYSALSSTSVSINIGVSQASNEIAKLWQAFNECITALDNKPLRAIEGVYFYGTQSLAYRKICWEKELVFKFYLDLGNTDIVKSLFSEFFNDLLNQRCNYTFMEYKYYILNLTNTIDTTPTKSSTKSVLSPDITDDLRQQLKFCFDSETLYEKTTRILLTICQRNLAHPIYHNENVIDNIQLYIKRNYYNDISLEFVSSLFFLNRSYVSTLFKAKTGMKFTEYLAQTRVEKAKELLQNPNLRLSQIASSVGYGNVKYFFRVFKKITGYTPEDFRTKFALERPTSS